MKYKGAVLLLAVCISSLFVGCEATPNPLSIGMKSIPIESRSSESAQKVNIEHVLEPLPTAKPTGSIEEISQTPPSILGTIETDSSPSVVYVQPTPIKQDRPEPLHILYAGDAMFDWSVKEAINRYGPDYPFLHIQSEIEQADFSFVNLETAVTLENEKDTNQIYNFKSNPESLSGLKNAGFDMVSVANNHSMDFLQKGFLDTLTHLDTAGLLYVGGGLNAQEAYRAKSVNVKGKTVKFLAFSRFIPTGDWFAGKNKPGIAQAYDRKPVLDAIARERESADYVLVYLHW